MVNMGLLKLFSSSFLREIDPHSGSGCSHSGCLCCEGGGGGAALVNMGVLKLFSSSFLREIEPHSGCLCCEGGGRPC